MPKTKKTEEVEVHNEKPVVCGHEEVRVEGDVKIFKCGAHGEHELSECQKLCT